MPRPLALTLIGAFVVVDLVLAVIVYRHVHREPPASNITAETTTTGEGALDNEQRAFEFDPAGAATLDVVNDGTTLLATRGACGGPAGTVLTGTDNGAGLTPRDTELTTVLSVQVENDGAMTVVGTEDDCVPVQRRSDDGGDTWDDDGEITLWYPSPTDATVVVAPGNRPSQPGCTVTSLSQIDDEFARVTCVDGVVRGTGNGGAEWVILGRLDNIRAATFTTFDSAFALARYQGCAAFVFSTQDSGATWTEGSCIVGDPARAIASSDTALVAAVGAEPQLYVSDNAGESFGQP